MTTTKTYIIDNGKSWSDRRLYFIEADPADFEPLPLGRAHCLATDVYTLMAVAPFEQRVSSISLEGYPTP